MSERTLAAGLSLQVSDPIFFFRPGATDQQLQPQPPFYRSRVFVDCLTNGNADDFGVQLYAEM